MPQKRTKTRYITLSQDSGVFSTIFKKFTPATDKYNFSDLSVLRRLFSNEKARILHIIREEKPESLYQLAKKLGRDFKSVSEDINILESIGFIDIIEEKKGKRIKHRPVLAVEELIISFSI